MVGRFQCILKHLMRPQSTNRFYSPAVKPKLPLVLQSKITAQVSKNPGYFIQQILTGGSCLTPQAHPEGPYLKMAQPITNEACDKELNTKDEGQVTSQSHEMGSFPEEKGNTLNTETSKGKRRRNEVSQSSDETRAPKRKPPNYFVAVQITDPQIHSAAKKVQEKILEASEADISSTRIEPATFHITLMVMHLENEESIKRAEETLEKLGPILASKLGDQDVVVEFKGLSVFGGGRVVFTPPQASRGLDSLRSIAEETVIQMKENGIHSSDQDKKVFRPHLTLFKFKDDKHLFKQGIRKIQKSLYAPFIEEQFGFQKVSSIQLCQMGEKREDGYYAVNKEVTWQAQDLS